MPNIKNNFEESLRFVAKHYKHGIFNPNKKWSEITGGKSTVIFRPAILMRVAAVAVILIISGVVLLQRPHDKTITAKANPTVSVLPDQSEVTLLPGAKLAYEKSFGKENRSVTMSGNIAFKVAENKDKPFIVRTPAVEIKVLGTTFDVSENGEGTQLKVHTGKVGFAPKDLSVTFICTKNMSAAYNINEKEATVISGASVCAVNGKNSQLTFKNMLLSEVCRVLEGYFGTKITLPANEENIKLTSTFTGKNIDEIINIINLTLDSHVRK